MKGFQRVVDPDDLVLNAPREKQFITGSEAVAEAIKRANIDMAIAFPITPQSESMNLIGELYKEGYLKDYFRAENEFAVMAAIHGASLAGGRVFTATSGPGTLRAMEMFPVWAGARQPIVCSFMCRGISLPPSIQPENIEMGMLLDTGMIMLHAENVQDLFDMILKAYIIAEKTDVHIPVGVFSDGFFVTHTRENVVLPSEELKMSSYHGDCSPVPIFNMETPPIRNCRDPLLNKSNFISYAANASWHQEVLAASERARRYLDYYLDGLIEIINPTGDLLMITSGTAVSQCREALSILRDKGVDAGLIKIKSIRPFPEKEIIELTQNAKFIIVPEFNAGGWLAREIKSILNHNDRVIGAPRVFGGMTMPVEIIVETAINVLNGNKKEAGGQK